MSKFLDESEYNQLKQNLVNLGLSEHEANVYLALLHLGQVGSSKIIKLTGLHGQYVYQALHALETKGLTNHVIINNRKKFYSKDPQTLLAIVDQQRALAEKTTHQLHNLISLPSPQQFDIYQGSDSYVRYEFQSLMQASIHEELCVIGGTGDHFYNIMHLHLQEYERIRKRKEIHIRYLGSIEQKAELEAMKENRPHFEFRLLPGLFTGLVNTNIWAEHIALNLFGNPVVCFTITNRQVAESYKGFFNTLWELGK